jgi:hypothetical protein
MKQMLKPNSKVPWGNRYGYLIVRIPLEMLDNPLDILRRVKKNIDRKKMSFAVFIMGKALGYVTKLKGPQVHQLLLLSLGEITEEN